MVERFNLDTTPERSQLMAKVRQSGTSPEIRVRRLLHALGKRFRVKGKGLPGTPDIVNRSSGWVIFVHGCFWHAHEGCHLWKIPSRNQEFWSKKFFDNRERDGRKINDLEQLGYSVLVLWQCELNKEVDLKRKLLNFIEKARTKKNRKILKHGYSSHKTSEPKKS